MFLHFDGDWRDGMSLAVFLYANAYQDHEHDEGDDALFFRGENEEVHSRLIWRNVTPP
jgi:hypothetical protein